MAYRSCIRKEKSIDEIISEFCVSSKNFRNIEMNARAIKSHGFSRVIDVKGDGNCLIYSIIVYLYYTRDINSFVYSVMTYCDKETLVELFRRPKYVITNYRMMLSIATNIRKCIVSKWDYIGSPWFHMNGDAIDGLAREMVMRLLGVSMITCYTLCPNERESYIRKTNIPTDLVDLRPDIDTKWHVSLFSNFSFNHYAALL